VNRRNSRNTGDDCEASRAYGPLSTRKERGPRFTSLDLPSRFWPCKAGFNQYPQQEDGSVPDVVRLASVTPGNSAAGCDCLSEWSGRSRLRLAAGTWATRDARATGIAAPPHAVPTSGCSGPGRCYPRCIRRDTRHRTGYTCCSLADRCCCSFWASSFVPPSRHRPGRSSIDRPSCTPSRCSCRDRHSPLAHLRQARQQQRHEAGRARSDAVTESGRRSARVNQNDRNP
jgi:hypothetical protein